VLQDKPLAQEPRRVVGDPPQLRLHGLAALPLLGRQVGVARSEYLGVARGLLTPTRAPTLGLTLLLAVRSQIGRRLTRDGVLAQVPRTRLGPQMPAGAG
jgi:hypothetical protein